jgi:hypothetical protein
MSEQELTLEDRVKNVVAGGVAGAAIHHAIGMLRVEMESQNGRRLPSPHGKEIGPLVMMASMFFPEHRAKYIAAGFGAGMTLDDLIWHTLEDLNIKPLTINQTGDVDIIEKYSKLIHIDENLSAAEKEDIIFPIFPQVIEEQRENPMQISAIERWKQELKLSPNGMKLMDGYWCQQWFLYWGTYSGNEGLYGGHDRFRTIAKLMRVRDRGDIKKNGHPSFIYDCDCGSIATNQLIDSYGYDYYYMLISQRGVEEGINPCHHIFPIIEGAGRKWVCETIKELPMVPIEYVGKLFEHLTRAVIVPPNGEWYEYEDWKNYKHKPKVR